MEGHRLPHSKLNVGMQRDTRLVKTYAGRMCRRSVGAAGGGVHHALPGHAVWPQWRPRGQRARSAASPTFTVSACICSYLLLRRLCPAASTDTKGVALLPPPGPPLLSPICCHGRCANTQISLFLTLKVSFIGERQSCSLARSSWSSPPGNWLCLRCLAFLVISRLVCGL